MFIARDKELTELREAFSSNHKEAVLIYGKRRVGKSTLISKAAEGFKGTVINHICAKTTYAGNLELLSRSVSLSFNMPPVSFSRIEDIFSFLNNRNENILLIIDEYQYFKENAKDLDSRMQAMIDTVGDRIKVVLCGSYITLMKELLLEENPLFGRFSLVIHLEDFDYYDSSEFFLESTSRDKIILYSVFGGSPYVLSNIDSGKSIKDNIVRNILPSTSILRIYIESVMLREIEKAYDVRIFSIIGNGKKKYSEIESALNVKSSGLLDKQLKMLIDMEAIKKVAPINKVNDRKKQFYSISDNLMRFYFTFIFGNEALISKLGENAYYDNYIEPQLTEFISRRFEDICMQYFSRRIHSGLLTGILDLGTLWYDDPNTKQNGEFDCVLKKKDGYDFYECKFYKAPMKITECKKEEAEVRQLKNIPVSGIGFICSAGFDFNSGNYTLIDGDELYK